MTEAALISPVFFMLLFGVIEMALMFQSKLTVTNAARDSARTAASAGNDVDADWRILQTIKQTYAPSIRDDIVRIVVFKATDTSSQPTPTCAAGTASSSSPQCNVYVPSDLDRPVTDFVCAANTLDWFWCPTTGTNRDTRLSSLGYIGVYIEMKHDYVTGFFGSQRSFKETVVFRFEPRTSV